MEVLSGLSGLENKQMKLGGKNGREDTGGCEGTERDGVDQNHITCMEFSNSKKY